MLLAALKELCEQPAAKQVYEDVQENTIVNGKSNVILIPQ